MTGKSRLSRQSFNFKKGKQMKNPFNRIVGPDGEWRRDDDAEIPEVVDADEESQSPLSERDEFIMRCLNASVNLYGIVTAGEFCDIYNHYAKGHSASVSNPLREDEALAVGRRILDGLADEDDSGEFDALVDDAWYSMFHDDGPGEWLFIYEPLEDNLMVDCDHSIATVRGKRHFARKIAKVRADFYDVPLKVLPEKTFLDYEDPNGDEETPESKNLIRLLQKHYCLKNSDAEFEACSIIAHLRVNGASIPKALSYISEECEFQPADGDELRSLIDALSPVVSTTRIWDYRGHTQYEMFEMGKIEKLTTEKIPDYFGVMDGEDYRDGDDLLDISVGELPPAKYTGPIDFKFVKDPVERDRALFDYEGVLLVTKDFVRRVVMRELTSEERLDAAKRLGFEINPKAGAVLDLTLDMVAGDFASMMDDQHGEPAIKRVLNRKEELSKRDRAAAAYYENYRYTWLEVLAVKAGVGMKCRDLLTGEELFLMEKSFSLCDVKGMTVCAGIAPMGKVYLSLGCIHPANFDKPAAILKIVLTHLGLPTEPPIALSFADQARFAAETIRRVKANGYFSRIVT